MNDECELCGGKGEIETVDKDGDDQVVPCPSCVSDDLHDQMRDKDRCIGRLREALLLASQRFTEYEAIHIAKNNNVKAERNRRMAEICETALSENK